MTIQHYDHIAGKFEQKPSYKVKKLLELNRIKCLCFGVYECLPIDGYNTRTYVIRESYGKYVCNCQGYRKKNDCSHVQAVIRYKEKTEPGEKQPLLFGREAA
jgi:hypothetical protein